MADATPRKSGAFVSEVVVQGIRRFGEIRRFSFGPGYNVVFGLSSSGKSTLYDVLKSLLFAGASEGESEGFRSLLPGGQAACRAGLSLQLDGGLFRVLKDYKAGQTTLSQYIAAEKRFDLRMSDAAEIERWLDGEARFPRGPVVDRLLSLRRADLPSSSGEGTDAVAGGAEPLDDAFEAEIKVAGVAKNRARFDALLSQYRSCQEFKSSELRQDEARSELFEVEQKIQRAREIEVRLAEIRKELKPMAHASPLPPGIDARIDQFKRFEKTYEAERGQLKAREDEARKGLDVLIPAPYSLKDMRLTSPAKILTTILNKDLPFDGGLASFVVGLGMVAAGIQFFNLGAILLLGGLALASYRGIWVFLRAKEKSDVLRKALDATLEQIAVLDRKREMETGVVRGLMREYLVDDPWELKEAAERRDKLAAEDGKLSKEMTSLVPSGGVTALESGRKERIAETERLDARIAELAGMAATDTHLLEAQIERLDRELARAEGRRPRSRERLFSPDAEATEAEGPAVAGDPIARVVDAWCDARRADPERLLRTVQEAYSQTLRALSGGRFAEGTFDPEGRVALRGNGRGPVPYEKLDPESKDVAFLALRMALFELEARGERRGFVLLDDPFELPDRPLAVVSHLLKALGEDLQIVHLTGRVAHRKLADHVLEI